MLPSAILRPARRGSPTADNAARAFPSHARPFLAGAVPLALLALVLAFFAASPLAAKMDAVSETMRFEGMAPGIPLLAWADTPYEHVAIGGGDIRFLYEGGQYAGTFPDPVESESRAHALACLTRHPARILAFGRGVLGPLRFLLRHPVERMDVVDPDRKAFDLVRRWMAQEDAAALGDPRVRIFFDDPRRFLAASRDRYDLILILEPDPVTLLRARLTTVEFYRLAADHLSEGGAVVASLTTAPNVVTGETAAMGGSIYGALVRVFPRVCAGPGPDGLLLAGTDPREVTLDPAVLGSRWRERQLASEVFVAEMFGQLFPPERVRAQEAALAEASLRVSPSRDDRPVSFLHALARRQAIRGGWMGGILSLLSGLSRTALAALALGPSVCFALFVLLRRSRTGLPAAALYATVVTGICGMVWSLLILFSFQTVSGALYGQLGLLTALFMLGLAIGGRIASRAAGFGAERGRRWLLAACAIACLFSAGVGFATDAARFFAGSGVWAASLLHGALLLASGAVTALVFPVASGVLLASGRDAGAAAGAVESADHAGAAFAALLGAVVFIPVFGTEGTALLLAGLQALAFVILLRETQDVSRSAAVR
jgi:spermidine synthase